MLKHELQKLVEQYKLSKKRTIQGESIYNRIVEQCKKSASRGFSFENVKVTTHLQKVRELGNLDIEVLNRLEEQGLSVSATLQDKVKLDMYSEEMVVTEVWFTINW